MGFSVWRGGKHGVDGVEYVCSLSPSRPEKSTVLSTREGESAFPAGVLASFCPSGCCCCCCVALRSVGLGVVEVPGIARALFLLFSFGVGNGGSDLGIALRALLINRSFGSYFRALHGNGLGGYYGLQTAFCVIRYRDKQHLVIMGHSVGFGASKFSALPFSVSALDRDVTDVLSCM